ncbi:MAG: division/cell wall cluster transcriptional repressor MraZ [Proteobacteria bacterium]|nr:division/cell wall cluster transcriptional repressor MraZ [Pseudomonadota bacterium]
MPSRFREVLSALGDCNLVITTGLDPCLVAYPLQEWLAFEQRLADLPQFDESVAMLRRIYVSGAVECELDKLGRLLIPQTLRQHAGLTREALWAGMGRHVELWDKTRFGELNGAVLEDPKKRNAMARRLAELGL